MTRQLEQLLLDTNIIIYAHTNKFWSNICNSYQIILPATIIEDEAFFFSTDKGKKQAINLSKLIDEGKITRVEASIEDYRKLTKRLSDNFLYGIDAGEKEALAVLISNPKTQILFSSGDGLAVKALGVLGISSQGISLEEIVNRIGIGKKQKLPNHYTKKWFKEKISLGISERDLWIRK